MAKVFSWKAPAFLLLFNRCVFFPRTYRKAPVGLQRQKREKVWADPALERPNSKRKIMQLVNYSHLEIGADCLFGT